MSLEFVSAERSFLNVPSNPLTKTRTVFSGRRVLVNMNLNALLEKHGILHPMYTDASTAVFPSNLEANSSHSIAAFARELQDSLGDVGVTTPLVGTSTDGCDHAGTFSHQIRMALGDLFRSSDNNDLLKTDSMVTLDLGLIQKAIRAGQMLGNIMFTPKRMVEFLSGIYHRGLATASDRVEINVVASETSTAPAPATTTTAPAPAPAPAPAAPQYKGGFFRVPEGTTLSVEVVASSRENPKETRNWIVSVRQKTSPAS